MKILIEKADNKYVVTDEMELFCEEFNTFDEADKFLKSKLSGATIFKVIYYASRETK
jgi:hypothetical protein